MTWLAGIFAGMTAKLIALAVIVALLSSAAAWSIHHERNIGRAEVQAKWDLANAAAARVALTASEAARTKETKQAADFSTIGNDFLKVTTHEYPTVAPGIASGIAAGTLKLRDSCPAPARSSVPSAPASSRELDAARASALAYRAEAEARAVRIVTIGDEADARELRDGAQIAALQAVLTAERQ